MQLYTISEGATEGALVETFTLKSGDKIPAIKIGEPGRGSLEGVLPVQLLSQAFAEWQETGKVRIQFAELTTTKTGNPKLRQTETIGEIDRFIGVFRTPIGFRGGNDHTGDRNDRNDESAGWRDFPCIQTIVKGIIAQGDAGRMGSGSQLVAVMPMGKVFRTGISGRRYGSPTAYYYLHDGMRLSCMTWEERQIADLW